MRTDFSLARPVGHLIMGDGSGPDGLAEKDGAKALSGAESGDTATTQLDKPSRTKNLIIEYQACALIVETFLDPAYNPSAPPQAAAAPYRQWLAQQLYASLEDRVLHRFLTA